MESEISHIGHKLGHLFGFRPGYCVQEDFNGGFGAVVGTFDLAPAEESKAV